MVDVRNLKQSVTFKAAPAEVYHTLVDPERHAAFSGAEAEMDPKPGGSFSAYGGELEGRVVDLTPGRRIVLAWRSTGWPTGHYSIADFAFKKVRGGTRLEFAQYGIPVSEFEGIRTGWKDYYWTPMKRYLEE